MRFFARRAAYEVLPPPYPVPEERRREECEKFGRFGDTFLSETRFTILTEFILRDIAMFISLVFTTNHPSLYWDTVQTPKRDLVNLYRLWEQDIPG